jgi:hypothetical protein
MVQVDQLDKRKTKQISRSIRAFWCHVLPAFRKVLGEFLRILPHPKPTFDLKTKVFEGFFRDHKKVFCPPVKGLKILFRDGWQV